MSVQTEQLFAESGTGGEIPDGSVTLEKLALGTEDYVITYDALGNAIEIPFPSGGVIPDGSITLPKLALGTEDTFITYDESGNAIETDAVNTSSDLFFDSVDARFTAELGLPDLQSWTSTNSSLFDDTIFGKEKKSVKFLTGSASKVLTGADWDYILANGASYGGTIRFESNTSGNSLLSGFGFSAANDPRPTSVRSRILPRILIDATYTIINYEGQSDVILDGQNGVPLVMKNEFFDLNVKVNPTPDSGVNFGAIDVYVNGVLISSGTINTTINNAVSDIVSISRWSGTGDVTYYIGNFGLTIYKEPSTKTIATEAMATDAIKLIIPDGIREYEVILPDNSARPIGSVFEIVANNIGGSITLRTQDLNAPQVLFNGFSSYTIYIEDKETISFTNTVDNNNVYVGTLPHKELSKDLVNTMSTGMLTYDGLSEGSSNLHSIIGASTIHFIDKRLLTVVTKEYPAEEVLADNALLTGMTTQVIHYFRDIFGNIIQSGVPWPTADQRRELVYCGNTDISNDYTFLTGWNNPIRSGLGGGSDLTFDILETLGGMKGKGHKITPSTTGLTFDLGSGLGIRYGGNFGNDERPHTPDSPALTFGVGEFTSFVLGSKASNGLLKFGDVATALDVDNYQLLEQNGSLTTVPVDKFTIQKIYRYAGTNFVLVEYGSVFYETIEQARLNLESEPYNHDEQLVPALFLGWLIVKQGITHLGNAITNDDARIVNYDNPVRPAFTSGVETVQTNLKGADAFGDFSRNSVQTFAANTSESIVFTDTNQFREVALDDTNLDEVIIQQPGLYDILLRLQPHRTGSGTTHYMYIWVETSIDAGANWISIPNSSLKLELETAGANTSVTHTSATQLSAGDRVRFRVLVDDAQMELQAESEVLTPLAESRPAMPSCRVIVEKASV